MTTEPSDDYFRDFQRLVGEIFRLNGMLLLVSEQLGQDLDISMARWQAMGILHAQAPLTVAEMARRAGLRRQSMQRTVNRLREQALVEPRENPDHKRAPLFRLTPKGDELMAELLQRQAELTRWLTNDFALSPDDIVTTSKLLIDLRENGRSALEQRQRQVRHR